MVYPQSPQCQPEDYDVEEDNESAAGSYSTATASWINHVEARFPDPMPFPYHIGSGYSVAPGINSEPGSVANQSHYTSGEGSNEDRLRPPKFKTPTEKALESLNELYNMEHSHGSHHSSATDDSPRDGPIRSSTRRGTTKATTTTPSTCPVEDPKPRPRKENHKSSTKVKYLLKTVATVVAGRRRSGASTH